MAEENNNSQSQPNNSAERLMSDDDFVNALANITPGSNDGDAELQFILEALSEDHGDPVTEQMQNIHDSENFLIDSETDAQIAINEFISGTSEENTIDSSTVPAYQPSEPHHVTVSSNYDYDYDDYIVTITDGWS